MSNLAKHVYIYSVDSVFVCFLHFLIFPLLAAFIFFTYFQLFLGCCSKEFLYAAFVNVYSDIQARFSHIFLIIIYYTNWLLLYCTFS